MKIGGLNKARGLEALISTTRPRVSFSDETPYTHETHESENTQEAENLSPASDSGLVYAKTGSVIPNTSQPRTEFDEAALGELADSITAHGVIQPLLVQKRGEYYEIIAGERRWRAAKLAGLEEIPVVVKDYSPQETLEISLIENIQREDLNPIEEASAYRRLVEEYSLSQEDVAAKVSKSRSTVTNSLRLLKLDPRAQKMLVDGIITSGHARALLALGNPEDQADAANQIAIKGLSVRETEKLVKSYGKTKTPAPRSDAQLDAVYESFEDSLRRKLGTKVSIKQKASGKGSIEIDFYSAEEFERLFDLFGQINTEES